MFSNCCFDRFTQKQSMSHLMNIKYGDPKNTTSNLNVLQPKILRTLNILQPHDSYSSACTGSSRKNLYRTPGLFGFRWANPIPQHQLIGRWGLAPPQQQQPEQQGPTARALFREGVDPLCTLTFALKSNKHRKAKERLGTHNEKQQVRNERETRILCNKPRSCFWGVETPSSSCFASGGGG